MRKPTRKVATSGMTTTGIRLRMNLGIGTFLIAITMPPAIRPAASPPRKPAPISLAMSPPTMPGVNPGRSAIA
jgi:hypothetical protein